MQHALQVLGALCPAPGIWFGLQALLRMYTVHNSSAQPLLLYRNSNNIKNTLLVQLDSDAYIGTYKTMDPELIAGLGDKWSMENIAPYLPKYKGMPHPPPKTGNAQVRFAGLKHAACW
jgi:hypothetical protein